MLEKRYQPEGQQAEDVATLNCKSNAASLYDFLCFPFTCLLIFKVCTLGWRDGSAGKETLAAKLGNLNLNPETHMVEREN